MMNQSNKTPLSSFVETDVRQSSLLAVRPVVAADRLYQLAAVTAGIFLLVTLL